MLVEIVTCYESNEERVSFILEACLSRGYEVKVITTDYSHIRKEKRSNIPDGYFSIRTKPYKKNLSCERLLSHKQFAEDAFKQVEMDNPDLIWIMAPANSLIKEGNKYKQNHPDTKIIIDVIDMWPESLPVNYNKHLFPFNLWRNIRKNYINCADTLVTECDFYQDILSEEYKKDIKTIYWAKDIVNVDKNLDLPTDRLSLVYIGSINNIIDIERIYSLIWNCGMPVNLHIIGEGEKTTEFINRLKTICYVEYHGVVRDEEKKSEIFKKCHAGINIYKKGLYIGLTVKCLDYFEYGLPIINNIKGDTWFFVIKNNVGTNVDNKTVINSEELIEMRNNNKNIYDLFENNFTKEAFEKKCLEVIDEVLQ